MPDHAAAPACNPGFLDTLTWDAPRAARLGRRAVRDGRFAPLAAAVTAGYPDTAQALDRLIRRASQPPLTLIPASACAHPRSGLWLVGILEDGQRVFVSVAGGTSAPPRGFGAPLCAGEANVAGRRVAVRLFTVDLTRLRAFLADVAPAYAPAVPARPGLGIGCRMGVLDVPVALRAVTRFGLCASVIQSSVYRELAPLGDLTKLPLPQIDLPGVGLVPLGHTGMSITGQFVAMTLERIALGDPAPIAVDADHLPLRAASGAGQRLARRLIREAQDRSLFTLDPHFCFYGGDPTLMSAMAEGRVADVEAAFRARFSPGARRDLLARYAGKRFQVPDPMGRTSPVIDMSAPELADCALRFQEPLDAIQDACAEIRRVKAGRPFAIEVSVDEVPGMSEPHHFYYLCAELQRRNIPSFSLAPGLGFSKLDVDVRDPRGAFATRVRILAGIARHFGAVMGIHSGDGKSVRTRQILAKATGGHFWYKISPDRQRNFFRSLGLCPPGSEGRDLFHEVYRTALCRLIRLAAGAADVGRGRGSDQTTQVARQTLAAVTNGRGLSREISREVLRLLGQARIVSPVAWEALARKIAKATARQVPGNPGDQIVHDYAFATVSERDARGRFRLRGRFFTLPEEALAVYHRLDAAYLGNLVRSLHLAR
jgi:hypothetical protein